MNFNLPDPSLFPATYPSLQTAMPFIYQPLPAEPTDTADYTSYLGTPVYSNLVFDGGQTASDNGNPLRIDTVLFSISEKKNIVVTDVAGRKDANGNEVRGTIKEYIGMGDFEITIQGAIVNPYGNVFPKSDLIYLKELLRQSKPSKLASQFLNIFGVSNIVVMDYTVQEKMGTRNMVPFTIFALSDVPDTVNDQGFYTS